MSYTKGKWEVQLYTRRDSDNIRWIKAVGKRKPSICQTFKPHAEANARRICQCINSHDALLSACEELVKEAIDVGYDFEGNPVTDRARAAIAAAKKE